jgi:hypothetical protein
MHNKCTQDNQKTAVWYEQHCAHVRKVCQEQGLQTQGKRRKWWQEKSCTHTHTASTLGLEAALLSEAHLKSKMNTHAVARAAAPMKVGMRTTVPIRDCRQQTGVMLVALSCMHRHAPLRIQRGVRGSYGEQANLKNKQRFTASN